MSSISSGTITTIALVHSADTTGTLVLKTNNTGSGGTTALTLDTAQNASFANNLTLSAFTASTALALDASKNVVSVTNTGSGNNVLATSPTLVTPALGTPSALVVTNATGTASININGTVGATTPNTGAFTTATLSSNLTLNGGTANGVLFLNGSKVASSGSALTFDGTKFTQTASTTGILSEFVNSNSANQNGNVTAINDAGLQLRLSVFGSAAGTSGMASANSSLLYTTSDLNLISDNASGVIKFGLNGNAEKMRLDSTGLGIGTSSPSNKFEVQSSGSYSAGVDMPNAQLRLKHTTFPVQLYAGLDHVNRFAYVQASETGVGYRNLILQADGGNLGIGTRTPAAKLTVLDANAIPIRFGDIASAPTSQTAVYVGPSTSALSGGNGDLVLIPRTSDSRSILLYTGNGTATLRATLDSSGNLGIGTSSPTAKLHVDGGCRFIGDITAKSDNTGALYLYGGGSYIGGAGIIINGASSSDANIIAFYNSSFTERMRLSSSGNLGLGGTTNLTGSRLYVQQVAEAYTGGQSSYNSLYPSGYIQVLESRIVPGGLIGASLLVFSNTNSNGNTQAYIGAQTSNTDNGASTLVFGQKTSSTVWSERMRISTDGTFRVKGAGSAGTTDAVQFSGSAPANSLFLNSGGKVGIKTTDENQLSGPGQLIVKASGPVSGSNTYFAMRLSAETFADSGNYTTMIGMGVEPGPWSKGAIGYTRTEGGYDVGYIAFYLNSTIDNSMVAIANEKMRISHDGTFRVKGAGTAGSTDAVQFSGSAPANSLRILSTGTVCVGKGTDPADVSQTGWILATGGGSVSGSVTSGTNEIFVFDNVSTGGVAQVDFRTANSEKGNISWNNTSTTYNTTSDYRLKENIQPMTGALAKVAALKPCTFNWIENGSAGQGFIAHELAEVVPDCVTGEKDAVNKDGSINPQGVDTSFLIATLTAAIQEQQSIMESLTARIAALEAA